MKKRSVAALLVSACLASSWPQLAAGESRAEVSRPSSGAMLMRPERLRAPSALDDAVDPVLTWNENAGKAATAAGLAPLNDPLHESRVYAIMHIAIHDALNAIDRRSRPYAFDVVHVVPNADPGAAVAAAAKTVLEQLFSELPSELTSPDQIAAAIASVEADYATAVGKIPDTPARSQGLALGNAAALTVLALRSTDGAVDPSLGPFLNHNCPQPPLPPGVYQCTLGSDFIAFERWDNVTPFVLAHASQFRPGPPYKVDSRKYATDYDEVMSLGGDDITTPSARTPDQTQIALFWYESSPLKWNRIARTLSAQVGLDMWENARLFGLLNVTLADGYIAMVSTKNHYNYWRPVTAVRNGDTDGNPATTGDPKWTPLRVTPADQDYASGHSIEGGAGAEVLKQFFGTDHMNFQDCSTTLDAKSGRTCDDPSPTLRSFTTFSQAAAENAYSRILIGFHFRKSVLEGTEYGRKIGKRAVMLYFRPVH
jgi:hypothetical protein